MEIINTTIEELDGVVPGLTESYKLYHTSPPSTKVKILDVSDMRLNIRIPDIDIISTDKIVDILYNLSVTNKLHNTEMLVKFINKLELLLDININDKLSSITFSSKLLSLHRYLSFNIYDDLPPWTDVGYSTKYNYLILY